MSSEADMTIEEARELVSDSIRWPRVREFLWNFAPQIHKSWTVDVPGISGNPGISESPRIKTYILSSLGVEPCCHLFPKDDWSRLLLLDGSVLESIVKWLGALAYAESLRRVTDGATVRALKADLRGIYPEVFSWTMYFKGMAVAGDGAQSRSAGVQDVVAAGYAFLSSLLAPLPENLFRRFKLKLPKSFCDAEPADETSHNPSASAINPSFIAKLLKLKFPEAYALCCL